MSYGQDGSGTGIYAQRYDANGNAVGSETRVNTTTASDQSTPAVAALSDGGYVVTWMSDQDGSGSGIYAQRYDATATRSASETRVNTTTAGDQTNPAVAALLGRRLRRDLDVVCGQDGSGCGIYAQRYDATAMPSGARPASTPRRQATRIDPAVAALSDGGYVVTWMSYDQDGSGYGIYAQRYDASGNTRRQRDPRQHHDRKRPILSCRGRAARTAATS